MKKVLAILLGMIFSPYLFANNSLCATVKIEIKQELTLERQAFEASMKISNGLDSFALNNVSVTLNFSDAEGKPVIVSSDPNATMASFYVRLDDTTGVSSLNDLGRGRVSGGTIAAATSSEIKWLMIPVPGSANNLPEGKLYFVGAKLSYEYGGQQEEIEVDPDTIIVRPMPQLTLDYFLTEHVFGDDAFTPAIEPPVPYTLGVRIANNGAGLAKSVSLDSAQPTIVENKQGLAIGFTITGSYVNDQPAAPTLLMNFGDIPSKGRTMGRWIMETTLSGKFTEFTASVSHAAEYGGNLTSLIDGANTHFLIHDVLVDLPGRDSVNDFLAHDGNNKQLTVFESESLNLNTAQCVDCSPVYSMGATLSSAIPAQTGVRHQLTPQENHATFGFIKVSDPYKGSMALNQTIRADGRALNKHNAWLGKERSADKINFDHFIYIFDYNIRGDYSLNFVSSIDIPQPPTIQFMQDRTTYEGNNLGFLVRASDPNGTLPVLSSGALPVGASFSIDNADAPLAKGVFNWTPTLGQAGVYPVTFHATDGILSDSKVVVIKVNPANDIDGDGLPDDWEIEHFGDLSQGADDDYDGDGYSNLEEWENGWNPTIATKVPHAPMIHSPIFKGETDTLQPELVITNSQHSPDLEVSYAFEVYADEGMTKLVMQEAEVKEGSTQTSIYLSPNVDEAEILDNHWYFWRVRALSDEGNSVWTYGRFFVNTENDLPSTPQITFPNMDAIVSTYQPTLTAEPVFDPDYDEVTYSFYLFEENSGNSEPVHSITGMLAINNTIEWQVPNELNEDAFYTWHVVATDEHGSRSQSSTYRFFVSTKNNAPSSFNTLLPEKGSKVHSQDIRLSWASSKDPEGAEVTYDLQWGTDSTFEVYESVLNVLNSSDSVTYTLHNLLDNQYYYWRVRAFDGELYSPWVTSSFFVNTDNDAPNAPTVANPADGSTIEVLSPEFSVNSAIDPDGDEVVYLFELYSDPEMKKLIANTTSTTVSWVPDLSLLDNQWYYWRARAQDEHGAQSHWTPPHMFFVNNEGVNDAPEFEFVLPARDIELTEGSVLIQWIDNDPDSNAKITLWYEGDNGEIGTIVEGLNEDDDGEGDQYLWHITALPSGTYLIKAVITDEEHRIDVTALGKVTILPTSGQIFAQVLGSSELDEAGLKEVVVEVVLDRAPKIGTSVTVNIGVSKPTEAEIVSVIQDNEEKPLNYLYFTEANWNIPYQITLKGADDCIVDGDQPVDLKLYGVQSEDTGFAGIDPPDIPLINKDNEVPGQLLFLCDYVLLDKQIKGDTVTATYQAKLKNIGLGVTAASAQLQTSSSFTIKGNSLLQFFDIQQGEKVLSSNTITLEYAVNSGFHLGKLHWNISTSQQGNELPAQWNANNIGAVLKAGHLSISSSRYDLTSYGHSVGLLADTFYFVYRPLNGDGEIVAKLDSFNASGKNAQAGLMIRESSWTGSKHAYLNINPQGKGYFQYRWLSSWATRTDAEFSSTPTPWLKLVRKSDKIESFVSSDGNSWLKIGEQTISMVHSVLVGLALSSDSLLLKPANASFSNIWVEEY